MLCVASVSTDVEVGGLDGRQAATIRRRIPLRHRAVRAPPVAALFMHLSATSGSVASPASMTPRDVSVLLEQARALQRAVEEGGVGAQLKGKNLGLLCDVDDSPEAVLFRRAATELGAHVSHIRPRLTEASPDHEVLHTGRLLGRLDDAGECRGLAP